MTLAPSFSWKRKRPVTRVAKAGAQLLRPSDLPKKGPWNRERIERHRAEGLGYLANSSFAIVLVERLLSV